MMMLVVVGILFLVFGIGMLAFPNVARSLDRFGNSVRGQQSHQGDAYEVGRVIRGLALVGAGVGMLLFPFIVG